MIILIIINICVFTCKKEITPIDAQNFIGTWYSKADPESTERGNIEYIFEEFKNGKLYGYVVENGIKEKEIIMEIVDNNTCIYKLAQIPYWNAKNVGAEDIKYKFNFIGDNIIKQTSKHSPALERYFEVVKE